jgi:hypothetical protein
MLELLSDSSSNQQVGLIRQASDIATALEQSELLPHARLDFANAISSVTGYLLSAEEAATASQKTDGEPLHALARQASAYLLAALGNDDSGFGLAGIRQMIEWLPDSVIWISPSNSIQDAIDRVLPGGTIHLGQGTYSLSSSLKIGKPLTLVKDPSDVGKVVLIGPEEGAVIYVGNDTPGIAIDIELRNMSVREGIDGIIIGMSGEVRWGDSTRVTMVNMDISNVLKSGLTVISSDVVLQHCQIHGNGEFGIELHLNGNVDMEDCLIAGNGTAELAAIPYRQTAGIHAPERGTLSIIDSTIESNAGFGIAVAGYTQLDLKHSQISHNGMDGLLVSDQVTVNIEGNEIVSNTQMGIRFSDSSCPQIGSTGGLHTFIGSASGWGNLIPDASEVDGNEGGSICPLERHFFLLDPAL